MNLGSTWFLRAVVAVLAAIVAVICYFVLPGIAGGWADEYPSIGYLAWPVVLGLSATAVAFYAALFQTLKLLTYIDRKQVFSAQAVKALQNIKRCALIISGLYAGSLLIVYQVAQIEDAPGLILFTSVIVVIAAGVGVFAGVLQNLLQSAIKIKSENDLTV